MRKRLARRRARTSSSATHSAGQPAHASSPSHIFSVTKRTRRRTKSGYERTADEGRGTNHERDRDLRSRESQQPSPLSHPPWPRAGSMERDGVMAWAWAWAKAWQDRREGIHSHMVHTTSVQNTPHVGFLGLLSKDTSRTACVRAAQSRPRQSQSQTRPDQTIRAPSWLIRDPGVK